MQDKKMGIQEIMILVMIGIAAGILSGLVGIGGGIILVPALVYFMQYNQHQAQGTSLGVLTFPVVILGFLTYYRDSKLSGAPIDFRVVALLATGFLAGALLGSNIAIRIDKIMLKKIFGVVMLITSLKMLGIDKIFFSLFKK